MKIDPNRICCVAPVVALLVVSRYKKSAASPSAVPKHDARRHVATTFALHTDEVHRPGADHAATDEAEQWTESEEGGGRAAGRGDVGERVSREGLAPDDDEDAHRRPRRAP